MFCMGMYYCFCIKLKELVNEMCGGKIVFLLEGGYDLVGLSEGVADFFRVFLGDVLMDVGEIFGLRDEFDDKVWNVFIEVKVMY